VEEVASVGESIFALNPKDITTKWRIMRRVLKAAKPRKRWDTISEWLDRVNLEELSAIPMTDELGREGWCDQAIYQNYYIHAMIERGDKEKAIELSKSAADRFPRQGKFFRRLEALATLRMKRLVDADEIYRSLCSTGKPDWWILHEHAQVLRELLKPEEALRVMCKAALSHNKLDSLVTLFSDIAFLCRELKLNEQARNHLLLCKYVRDEQGWSIPVSIEVALGELDVELAQVIRHANLRDSILACKIFWHDTLGLRDDLQTQSLKNKKIKKTLQGKLILGNQDRPFCFISTENRDSFFCFKSDLPKEINDGTALIFDAIPSFDKKKNRESWKAVNIRVPRSQ
jgi:hypothetical protein